MRNNRTLFTFVTEGYFFKYAVIVSLAAHLAFFIQMSLRNQHSIRRSLKNLEITYYNLKLQTQNIDIRSAKDGKATGDAGKKAEVLVDKPSINETPIKDISKLEEKLVQQSAKLPATVTEIQVKRKISVPPLKSEKIKNPLYQSYYQIIRTMIKERAYSNYAKLDVGEVYLTFVLLSNGTLKQLQLIEERTSANQYLRDVSFNSIKEASPFPPFPKDLTYPELSFNVVISFEEEK